MWSDGAQSPCTQARWMELEKKYVAVFLLSKRLGSFSFLLLNESGCILQGSYSLIPPSKTRIWQTNQGFSAPPGTARIPKPLKTISTTCKRSFQQGCCGWLVALHASATPKYCSAFLLQRTVKISHNTCCLASLLLESPQSYQKVSLHVLQKPIHKNSAQRWEPLMGETAAGVWDWYHPISNI